MPKALWIYSAAPAACGYFVTSSKYENAVKVATMKAIRNGNQATPPTSVDTGPVIAKIPAPKGPEDVGLEIVTPAFMISELRRAFEIGFLLFIPFLIIDLVVASILMSVGMMMLPPASVALPFKLIFFVLVDGWTLVAGSLVQSYGN